MGAKAKVETKAKLKVEAKAKATANRNATPPRFSPGPHVDTDYRKRMQVHSVMPNEAVDTVFIVRLGTKHKAEHAEQTQAWPRQSRKNDNRDTPTAAKAKVKTKAKLKVEAKVKDNDLATDNCLVGGWGRDKGKGGDKGKAESGGKGKGQ